MNLYDGRTYVDGRINPTHCSPTESDISMRKIAGWIMMMSPLIIAIILLVVTGGWKITLFIFALISILVSLVLLGIKWIN